MFFETWMVFIIVRFDIQCRMEWLSYWICLCFIQSLHYAGTSAKDEHIIRCFDCSFDMRNNNCDDRFNTIGISVKNCTGSCMKVKMYKKGEDKVFARSCSIKKETEQCRVTDTGGGQRMEDCYCNSDLCNVGSQVELNGFLERLILLMSFVYILLDSLI